jgi:hypothetical protein
MRDLEKQTYDFAVAGISLIKSLEKEFPELVNSELKQNVGAVSIKYIDAINAQENEDFANNLRECHSSAEKSIELFSALGEIGNINLNEQKIKLINDSKIIIEKLDTVISKLIY